jgi:hypothetical protein
MDTSGSYLVGGVEVLEDGGRGAAGEGADLEAARTLETFATYRSRLAELRGVELEEGALPRDPTYLSYAVASASLLTLREQQELLEADTARDRLILLRHALREEMRAMRAIPSLPATDVARNSWSPN